MPLATITGEFGIATDPVISIGASGKAYLKVRGISKDRVRDSTGNWSDGNPCFIDIVCFGKEAENLFDSEGKGDSVLVSGKLQQNYWTDKEGKTHTDYRIVADSIGVSVRWTPAKTPRTLESGGQIASAVASLGATAIVEDTSEGVAPF